jgi:uncharacterized protein (DUF2062 family)
MPYSINSKIPSKKKQKQKSLLTRAFKYYKLRLFRLRSSPQKIARGLAVGTFAGCFPLFGLQIIIAVFLAIIFRGNKLAAMAGTWISNPFTYIPLFWFNFEVGRLFLLLLNFHVPSQTKNKMEWEFDSWQNLTDAGFEITTTLLIGSLIIGLLVSLIVYLVTLIFFAQKQKDNSF